MRRRASSSVSRRRWRSSRRSAQAAARWSRLALAEFLAVALVGVARWPRHRRGDAVRCLNGLFAAVLPLPLAPGIFPRELALGALYGLLTALAFAVAPLGRAHDLPVSQLFRALVETGPARPRLRYFARRGARRGRARRNGDPRQSAAQRRDRRRRRDGACAGRAAPRRARGAMALARRAPRARSVVWRLAIANLHRPGALTPSVVISLGLGLAVLVALTLVDSNLRGQLRHGDAGRDAELLFPRRAAHRHRGVPRASSASRRRGQRWSRRR